MRHLRCAGARGFTLIESLIVLVVLSIAAVAIVSMQSNIFSGQSTTKDVEIGAQLLQECAEQVLATRRRVGYAATPDCSTLGNYGGFGTPSITVTADNAGAACPSGGTCKQVVITLSKGGASLTPVTLELVSY